MVNTFLGQLFSVKSGESIAISDLSSSGEYPVYGGNGVAGFTNKYNVCSNTMIIGRVGEKCGNVFITKLNSWISDNALIVRKKKGYHDLYMMYLLENINLNSYANRNAQPVISGKTINNIEVSYKQNTEEQEAIASVLSDLDEHIDNLSELIEKKKAIRDGALEDLVGGKTRLDGLTIEWVETELGQVAGYRKGKTSAKRKHYVSTENMNQGFSGITPYVGSYMVEGCKFDKSDTLVANIRPYLKKIWYASFSGNCSADVLVLNSNGAVDPKYLYYLVANDRFIYYIMDGGIKGIKMPRGDKKYILHYPIRIPLDTDIQKTIASMLTAMDEEIESLEEEKAKMVQIREGAMDDLLTGRVRLKV